MVSIPKLCDTLVYFQHLKQQQEGLQHLISIIKEDVDDLKLIEQGLCDTATLQCR